MVSRICLASTIPDRFKPHHPPAVSTRTFPYLYVLRLMFLLKTLGEPDPRRQKWQDSCKVETGLLRCESCLPDAKSGPRPAKARKGLAKGGAVW